MSIANELSCDVAAALLLARQATSPAPSQTDLRELMLSFHSTLRQLTGKDRQRRRRALILDTPLPGSHNAAAATNN
jgi:hypothetical protein